MIKKIATDIRQMRTVSDLLDYIPRKALETASFALICVLCCLPFFSMLNCAVLGIKANQSAVEDMVQYLYTWVILVQSIGILGVIIGVIALVKSILDYRRMRKSAKEFLYDHPVQLLLAALLLWSAISCFLSNNVSLSFFGSSYRNEGLLMYLAYYGYFSMAYLLCGGSRQRKIIGLVALLALPVAAGIIFENEWLRTVLNFQYAKHANPFFNINHTAYYLCVSVMCAATRFVSGKKETAGLALWGAVLAFLTAALLINGSLGPYLAVIIGLIVMLAVGLILKKRIWKRAIAVCLIFSVVTGAYMLSSARLSKDTRRFAVDIIGIVTDNEAVEKTAGSGRWPIWTAAADFVQEKPIFGYGPENLGEQYAKRGLHFDRPHCVPLQIAASLGIPALALYLAALTVYIIFFFKRGRKLKIFDLMLFSTGTTYFVSSLVGNSMFYTSPYFCVIWGMALRLNSSEQRNQCQEILKDNLELLF